LLIGLVGRAGAGKSTVAGMMAEHYAFTELALAEPIAEMVHALFGMAGIDGAWAAERALKEEPTLLGFSYRHLAQSLGTEWGRGLAPDFWLRVLALRLNSPALQDENVVISDVRFPNEAEFITLCGGVLVRVLRSTTPQVRTHSSEQHADSIATTTELLNFGSFSTLADQVDRLIHTLRS
jgi:hypothetical protein